MKKLFWIAGAFILICGFSQLYKKFPEINFTTTEGKRFTNENFMGKNTVVALFHLGCPPAMALLKDIETFSPDQTGSVQFIGILENTPAQIKDFNNMADNDWSDIRQNFSLEPLKMPLIGECESAKVDSDQKEEIVGGRHCRLLAEKLKIKYSPTLVFVNGKGEIVKIKKGHYGQSKLLEDINKYLLRK